MGELVDDTALVATRFLALRWHEPPQVAGTIVICAAETDVSSRIIAHTPAHALRINLSRDNLTRALGQARERFDWANCPQPLRVSRVDAPCHADGPSYEEVLEDGEVLLRSGADGEWRAHPQRAPSLRSIMPSSFHALLAQQWARGGALPVHAAALRIGTLGILALGRRAAGKSVLGLSAVAAGHGLVSDDSVLLAPDAKGQVFAERLRHFAMLRRSSAGTLLARRLPELGFSDHNHPKLACPLPEEGDSRFPVTMAVDVVWLLERPRTGRIARSEAVPVAPVMALAALIEASSPLLFGPSFPHERQCLHLTFNRLLSHARCYRVTTGTDILDCPERVLARLAS